MKALLTAICLMVAGSAIAAEQKPLCKGNPKIVGECSTVHGRVGIYNGIPIRIWVVGTHHMLNVIDMHEPSQDEADALPPSVTKLLTLGNLGETVVFGEYEVCPLEKEHPGWMQAVCVENASHLIAAKWDGTLVPSQKSRYR